MPEGTATPTILVVDDEPGVHSALRRLIVDEDWDLVSASSTSEAEKLLESQAADIVLSDLRIPGGDGSAFLESVREKHPRAVRVVLKGYIEPDVVRDILTRDVAHHFLTKPWVDEDLLEMMRGILDAKVDRNSVDELLRSLPSLPTIPVIYEEIREVLTNDSHASMDQIAGIIKNDPSISVRLLRWSNSPLFGQRNRVETVNRAVIVLGTEMVSGLVLSMALFDELKSDEPLPDSFSRNGFWRHTMACASIARLIALEWGWGPKDADPAFTAGLLHDVGKVVLDRFFHDQFVEILEKTLGQESTFAQAEREIVGTTHSEIGGRLLEWWNLSEIPVNAARYHHTPQLSDHQPKVVAAVHIADVVAQRFGLGLSGNGAIPAVHKSTWKDHSLTRDQLANIKKVIEETE